MTHADPIFAPLAAGGVLKDYTHRELGAAAQVGAYLERCIGFSRSVYAQSGRAAADAPPTVDEIVKILIGHEFNYQSKGKVAAFVPDARARIARAMAERRPIEFFLLYHGGYRAGWRNGGPALSFEVGVTELMLIYQVARLQEKIARLYAPGVTFQVVINNGVAAYVNGVPLAKTLRWVRRFERLIAALGASNRIKVLTQSTLGSFDDRMGNASIAPWAEIDPMHLRLVPRFLGRECDNSEARYRAAAYYKAEEVWGREIRAIVDRHDAICCRQIASSVALSFRSFPGGAARVQNGAIGFRVGDDKITPVLITSTLAESQNVLTAPIDDFGFSAVNAALDFDDEGGAESTLAAADAARVLIGAVLEARAR